MIHFHGTPIGGKNTDVSTFLMGRHALVPFSEPRDLPLVAEACQSFCLDNGTFSAWTSGTPITDWRSYYQWCSEYVSHPGFEFAIIPDVICGTENDNDDLIGEWPLKRTYGVPVWHMHESLDRLSRLVSEWTRVAIGSSGNWKTPGSAAWWNRMGVAMSVACDANGRPKTRLHGLRMLDPKIFTKLPLASADSVNCGRNNGNTERWHGCYKPPTAGQRSIVIAWRIESQNSADHWRIPEPCELSTPLPLMQNVLFTDDEIPTE